MNTKTDYLKPFLITVLIALNVLFPASAQDTTMQKIKVFRTWVTVNQPPYEIRGILYAIKDSSIIIASSGIKRDYEPPETETTEIKISSIDRITVRRKNSVLSGMLIGALAGTGIGALIGYGQGDDPPCDYLCLFWWSAEDKAFAGGTVGFLAGGGIGAITGLIKKHIRISGSMEQFNRNKMILENHALRK